MEKQVIIDKGRGMYERVIWDDSTKERIGEDTIGFLKGDNGVVPIVGNEFIGQNASIFKDKTFPSECKYCKPNVRRSGISFEIQCKYLTAIEIIFSRPYCEYGSTLFNLRCTVQSPDIRYIVKFYDQDNKEYDSLLVDTSQLNFSGYLHTAYPHTITVQVQYRDPEIGGEYTTGECIRKFRYLAYVGFSVECVINITSTSAELDITYDRNKQLILYNGVYNLKNSPQEINLITTDNTYGPHFITSIPKGIVTAFKVEPALGWIGDSQSSYLLRNVNFHERTIAILGLFNNSQDTPSNFWTMRIGNLNK